MSRQQATNRELAADVGRANLLTNGGFEIWQRGDGPIANPPSTWSADRWALWPSGGAVGNPISARKVGDGLGGVAAEIIVGGAPDVANPSQLYQYPGTVGDTTIFHGLLVSLSMRVAAPVASGARIGIVPSTASGSTSTYSAYHSGSGNFETLRVTMQLPNNLTGIAFNVNVSFEKPGTYFVTDAMLVQGGVAADFVPLHPADDMARCQRYYEILGSRTDTLDNSLIVACYAPAGGGTYWTIPYKVQKAIKQPVVTKVGSWGVANCSQPTVDAIGQWACRLNAVATAAGSFYANANTSTGCYITVEANP